jgi:hypothetical protein
MTTINDPPYVHRLRPGVFEWFEAVTTYIEARDNGTVIEAHRERVRETWLMIEGRNEIELDCDELALMNEVMRPLQ